MFFPVCQQFSEKIYLFPFCDQITELSAKMVYNMGVKTRTPQKEIKNMNALKLNKDNFDSAIKSEKPVLLDFYADWCGPCRMVGPIVHEIADERDDIVVGKINVDEQPELAMQFGVMSIPTLVVLKNGEVVNQAMGARPKAQILAML
jgi:thioredoxin 1